MSRMQVRLGTGQKQTSSWPYFAWFEQLFFLISFFCTSWWWPPEGFYHTAREQHQPLGQETKSLSVSFNRPVDVSIKWDTGSHLAFKHKLAKSRPAPSAVVASDVTPPAIGAKSIKKSLMLILDLVLNRHHSECTCSILDRHSQFYYLIINACCH